MLGSKRSVNREDGNTEHQEDSVGRKGLETFKGMPFKPSTKGGPFYCYTASHSLHPSWKPCYLLNKKIVNESSFPQNWSLDLAPSPVPSPRPVLQGLLLPWVHTLWSGLQRQLSPTAQEK